MTTTPHRLNQPRFNRLRQYRELLIVQPRRSAELAERAEVSVRQVGRDLQFAKTEWGWEYRRNGSTRRLEARNSLPVPVLSLNEEEALALLVAEPALRAYGGGPFAAGLRSALRKISGAVDVPLPENLPPVGFELHTIRETDPELFRQFNAAVKRSERLRMTYFTPERGKPSDRLIDPYHVYNSDGGWYVAAYCHNRKDVIDFAISSYRVTRLDGTGEFFERPALFDPEAYRAGGFGLFKGGAPAEVVLHFHREQGIYQQERVRQKGETRDLQPDGSLLVRFVAPLNVGLRRWVLQYGSEVEVLAPEELRAEVAEEMQKMARIYGASKNWQPDKEGN